MHGQQAGELLCTNYPLDLWNRRALEMIAIDLTQRSRLGRRLTPRHHPFHVDGTRHVVSSPSVSGYRQSLRNSPRPQHLPPTPIHDILPAMRINSGLWPIHLAILIVGLLVSLTRCQSAPKPFPASNKGDFYTMQINPLARVITVPNSTTIDMRQPRHWLIGSNLG